MKKLSFLFLLFAILFPLMADEKPMVSVITFTPGAGVSAGDSAALTRAFEVKLVQSDAFRVIEQEERDNILKAQADSLSGCTDESCAIEIGKLLQADRMIMGSVGKVGRRFVMTVKMVKVEDGSTLDAEEETAESIEEALDKMAILAGRIAGAGSVSGGRAQVTFEEAPAGTSGSADSTTVQKAYVTFQSVPPGMRVRLLDTRGSEIWSGSAPKGAYLSFAEYVVEAEDPEGLYYPYSETHIVNDSRRQTYEIRMLPRFGSLSIDTTPPGMTVLLSGIPLGETPYENAKLKSGSYSFVLKDPANLYESRIVDITIRDGASEILSRTMEANFVEFSVRETAGIAAAIYIDGERKGVLPFSGRLPYRDFTLKIVPEDDRYDPMEEHIVVRRRGEHLEKRVTLAGRTGVLLVETEPFAEGRLYIDGEETGMFPDAVELLVGTYDVRVTVEHDGRTLEASGSAAIRQNRETRLVLDLKEPAAGRDMVLVEGGTLKKYFMMNIRSKTNEDFTGEIKEGLVLVAFLAGWDPNSKKVAPVLEELADERADIGIFEVDTEHSQALADQLGVTALPTMVLFKDGTLVEIKSGFMPKEEILRWIDSKNLNPAETAFTLANDDISLSSFYISAYEVTQGLYKEVMGSNPSNTGRGIGNDYPVTVSWYDAVAFCNTLSERDGLEPVYRIRGTNVTCDWTKNGYRLPTEAEWEFAARGGNEGRGYSYAGGNSIDDVAWYGDNSDGKSHPVGQKKANELGLFDMSGNVFEWCWDWSGSYPDGPQRDPTGPSSGGTRVLMGGSWYYGTSACQFYHSHRLADRPGNSNSGVGFRVARRL